MPAALARCIVLGMVVLAIVVQIGVWGATKLHADDGALLESWRPYFGWPYGLLFAAVQAGLCWWLTIDRGIVWLARTWGITGGALLVLWVITGKPGLRQRRRAHRRDGRADARCRTVRGSPRPGNATPRGRRDLTRPRRPRQSESVDSAGELRRWG